MTRFLIGLWACLLIGPHAWSADFGKLPTWAQATLQDVNLDNPQADANIWRLLDESEIHLTKANKLIQKRRIVQYVCTTAGASRASNFFIDGDEDGTRIKKLRGWHLSQTGKLEKLDRDNVVTVGLSESRAISNETLTLAQFNRVTRGSVVVFESTEERQPFFLSNNLSLTDIFPIEKRVIKLSMAPEAAQDRTMVLEPVNLDAFGLNFEKTDHSLTLNKIPGFEGQLYQPDFPDPYPMVKVGFHRKDPAQEPFHSWDNLAKWYYKVFNSSAKVSHANSSPINDIDNLKRIAAELDEKITYRQHYLSTARGWTPNAGAEVERLAYGDCKDMVACLAASAAKNQIPVLPVLANIVDGFRIGPGQKAAPHFNHLIGAVPLAQSLGLPAEAVLDGKSYLIMDPTAKYTPFGRLPQGYLGRQVLICTAEGAKWWSVPETALEKTGVKVKIGGVLDKYFTMRGSIDLTETGDALGLRTLDRSGNQQALVLGARFALDLPGVVDLKLVSRSAQKGQIKLIFQVNWPSFMRRDSGGLRLPHAITGYSVPGLARVGEPRVQPIHVTAIAPIVWDLSLRSEAALNPGMTQAEWQGSFYGFSWNATGGTKLSVQFQQNRKDKFYNKDQINNGLKDWREYRGQFNDFWLKGSLFSLN